MRRLTLIPVLCAAAALGAGIAHGELVQRGHLRLSFSGRFAPQALPRDRPAPVSASLNGSVKTVDGSRPPQLRRISIAVNRYSGISTRGLPACSTGRLEQTSTKAALARCGGALVGRGRFAANVDFPSLAPVPAAGRVLAFNGRNGRRRTILLHVFGTNPVRATFVLTFKITHPRKGMFGTVISAKIPRIAADFGYVTDLDLRFGRRYRFRGEPRSFLSARCAAPPGFRGAIFGFARGTFGFANGQQLTTTLTRNCRVR